MNPGAKIKDIAVMMNITYDPGCAPPFLNPLKTAYGMIKNNQAE